MVVEESARTWGEWLRHAFAVAPQDSCTPTEDERAVVVAVCEFVHRRQMIAPAILMAQSSAPLGGLGAQSLVFLQPLLEVVFDRRSLELWASFLARPGAIEYFCRTLEALSDSASNESPPSAGNRG